MIVREGTKRLNIALLTIINPNTHFCVTKLHYKITKIDLYILYSVYIDLHDIHYTACGYTRYSCIDVVRPRNTVSMYGMRYTIS